MMWLLILSFVPAIVMSVRHTPWIVWVVPILLAYVFKRQWQMQDVPVVTEQEEPPDFCFSRIAKKDQDLTTTKERWQTTLLRWRTAVVALPEGVVLLDQHFSICWFNPEAQNLLGFDFKQDLGMPFALRMNQPTLDDYLQRAHFEQSLEVSSPANGSLILNVRFVFLEKESLWLVLVRNITERFQLDRQQYDFLANISHELKTPVTVFRGLIELLPELSPASPQWDHSLSLLLKQVDRMQSLIEDQTALLRLGPAKHIYPPATLQMEGVLQDMVAEAEILSGSRGHGFRLSVEKHFIFRANLELIRRVVGNLLANAVNHTPDQTEVRITWQRDDLGQPTLTVSDNGPGIASYHLPRLTEKYYRVNFQQESATSTGQTQGSGLGLALVKQAMERCQGKLEIVSHPGIGSRFVCRFPAVLASEII